jgi:hypothetical protein
MTRVANRARRTDAYPPRADLTLKSPDGRPIRLVEGQVIKEWM